MHTPIYLALPDGPRQDEIMAALPEARSLGADLRGISLDGVEPGVLIFDAATTPLDEIAAVASALPPDGGGWRLGFVQSSEGGPTLRSVSLGRPHMLADLVGPDASPDEATLIDLHGALRQIARARHDLNNPLTSALAETQLGLLDAPEGEVREGLEIIQEQLRRLRDLLVETNHLRPFTS